MYTKLHHSRLQVGMYIDISIEDLGDITVEVGIGLMHLYDRAGTLASI